MRRIWELLLLAYVAVAQSPKATGPTFKLETADLSSPPAFVIYGDMRFTSWRFAGNASSAWARQALVRQIASEKPDALFLNGDVPYRGAYFGDYEVFEKETRIWRERRLRLYPVLGNHEFYNRNLLPSREPGLANWWKEFPVMKGLQWYSVQLGEQVYILCLDSNFGALQAGGPQRVWLDQQLSGLPNSFNYVFFVLHHAQAGDYLESGSGGFDRKANEDDLEIHLEHLQSRAHARFVVVAGHDHNYGRMERNGVIYIVSGGGGAHPVFFRRQPEDSFKGKDLLSGGKPLPNFHYIKFVLGPDGLNSAKGTADTAPVLRGFLNSAKAADARPETAKELAISLRGAFDTAAVLREFLESAQAAVRGTKQKRNSADVAAGGESVVRDFLKSTMVRISNPEAGHGDATWDCPDVFVITPHTEVQ